MFIVWLGCFSGAVVRLKFIFLFAFLNAFFVSVIAIWGLFLWLLMWPSIIVFGCFLLWFTMFTSRFAVSVFGMW